MANSSGVVGVLRALLTADTASFDTSMRKSATVADSTSKSIEDLGKAVVKLAPQAERMVKAFSGDRLTATANNLVAAVTKIGGASKLTEAEQARTNRTLTEAIAKYAALGKTAPAAMLALEQATRKVPPPTDDVNASSKSLTATIQGLGKSILTTAAGFFTAQAAFALLRTAVRDLVAEIKTLTIEGAAVGDVTENFNQLTAGAKQSGAALLGALRQGTHATIDDFTLMKLVNQDLTAGLKLTQDQFNLLARGAFALAQKSGGDVATGLQEINEALLTGRTRSIAAVIGRVNQTAAEERYLRSINKVGQTLSEEGKLEATRAEIFRRLGLSIDRLGEQTDGLDEKVQQAQTTWRNFQIDLGRTVATSPVILAALDGLAQGLADLFGNKREDAIQNIAKAIDAVAIELVELAKTAVNSGGFIIKEFIAVNKLFGNTAQVVDGVRLALLAAQQSAALASGDFAGWKKLDDQMGSLMLTMSNRGKALQAMDADQKNVDKSTDSLNKVIESIRQRMVAASSATRDHSAALKETGAATRGVTDDVESLTQASSEAKAAAKAYKEALDAIAQSSRVLAPVQQETIRLLYEAGIGSDTIAKALKLTTDEVNKAIEQIKLYGRQYGSLDAALAAVTDSIRGLTAEQQAQIKAGLDSGLSVDDLTKKLNLLYPALHIGTVAVKEFGDRLKDSEKFAKDLAKTNQEVANSIHEQSQAIAERRQSEQLEQIRQLPAAERDAARTSAEIATRRAEHEIEAAKQTGANWKQVYALERNLSRQKRDFAIADAAAEFNARTQDIRERLARNPNAVDQAQLDSEQRNLELRIQQINEDFNLGEQEKQAALKHTHEIWTRTWDNMKAFASDAIASVADGFASMLVGARSFKEGFLDIWHSIQRGIQSILADLLNYFIRVFLAEMVGAIISARLGDVLRNSFKIGAGTGAATSPWWLPSIPGIGGGGHNPHAPDQGVPKTPTGPGIVPIPPTEPGGGGHVPAPPKIVTTSVDVSRPPTPTRPPIGTIEPPPAVAPPSGPVSPTPTPVVTAPPVSTSPPARTSPAAPATSSSPTTSAANEEGSRGLFGLKGRHGNTIRDNFLKQFGPFDYKRDDMNPPGFYGLDALLTKYKHHDLFVKLIRAKDPPYVRRAEKEIAAALAFTRRSFHIYHSGGVIGDQPFNAQGEVFIKALKGEAVLTPTATASLGGAPAVSKLNAQPKVAMAVGAILGGPVGVPLYPKAPFAGLAQPTQSLPMLYSRGGTGVARGGSGGSTILPSTRRPMMSLPTSLTNMAALAAMLSGLVIPSGMPKLKMYGMGGYVPPGVVQPAMLHGPEYVIPAKDMQHHGSQPITIVNENHFAISTIDEQGVKKFVQSEPFTHHMGTVFEKNINFLTTRVSKAQQGIR